MGVVRRGGGAEGVQLLGFGRGDVRGGGEGGDPEGGEGGFRGLGRGVSLGFLVWVEYVVVLAEGTPDDILFLRQSPS